MRFGIRCLIALWVYGLLAGVTFAQNDVQLVRGQLVCAVSGEPIHSAVIGGRLRSRFEDGWYTAFPMLLESVRGEFTWHFEKGGHSFRRRPRRGHRGQLFTSAEGYSFWKSEELQYTKGEVYDLGTIELVPLENELERIAGRITDAETGAVIPSTKLHLELHRTPEAEAFVLRDRDRDSRFYFERRSVPLVCTDPRDWSPPWPLDVHRTRANSYGKFELFVEQSLDWKWVCVARGYRPKSFERSELLQSIGRDGLQSLA